MFLLWVTAALSNYDPKQKLYLPGPEGTLWVTAHSWGQEELEGEVHNGKACFDLPQRLSPSDSITTHTGWYNRNWWWHQPELVLINPPFRKPYELSWQSPMIWITWFILWGLILILFCFFFLSRANKKTQSKTICFQHRLQRRAQGTTAVSMLLPRPLRRLATSFC